MHIAIAGEATAGGNQHTDRHRLRQEIARLETPLAQIAGHDDSACAKALTRAGEGRLDERHARLAALGRWATRR